MTCTREQARKSGSDSSVTVHSSRREGALLFGPKDTTRQCGPWGWHIVAKMLWPLRFANICRLISWSLPEGGFTTNPRGRVANIAPPRRTRTRLGLATFVTASLVLPLFSGVATAIPINVTDPSKMLETSIGACVSSGVKFTDCKSTAFISTTSLTGNDAEFKKSFDAWNATNAADNQWALVDGGLLPASSLNVSLFEADANSSLGGLRIRIGWDYNGPDKVAFYWSQALYDNYVIGQGIVMPFYEMDVNDLYYSPPLYPFQYQDRHFFDFPEAYWPDAFFTAEAFLSEADQTARTLTVYEGVRYGFELSGTAVVPEPPTIALLGLGIAAFLAGWRLRSRDARGIASLHWQGKS